MAKNGRYRRRLVPPTPSTIKTHITLNHDLGTAHIRGLVYRGKQCSMRITCGESRAIDFGEIHIERGQVRFIGPVTTTWACS